jgi:ribonuclease J
MPGLDVMPGDRVLLSSRYIPGNEVAIGRAVDGLVARGAEVLWEDFRALHASGHAQEEEQRRLVRLARPEHFVPIHGELRHLVRHAGHAGAEGLAEGRRHVLVDGEVLELSDAGVRRSGDRVHAGRVFLQRDGGATAVGADVVRDRRVLSELGLALVVLAVHAGTGELARPPVVRSRGVAGIEGREDEVAAELARGLAELPPGARDPATLEREAALAVRRWFRRTTGPRPPVEVVVLEV